MRILVYPHDLGIGGSQLNAVEIAAAVRDYGHDVMLFGRPGALLARIDELGLDFIEGPEPGFRPTPRVAARIRSLVRDHRIEVVHGYEWPPALEAILGTAGTRAQPVATVMSMAVAPFIPKGVPLMVGTHQIAAAEQAAGRRRMAVLEPPVDLGHNRTPPPGEVRDFRQRWGVADGLLTVCVSRLASQLKAEGLFAAIEAVTRIAAHHPAQLLLVGDGPERPALEQAAAEANRVTGTNTVVLTGALVDPRPAYAAADVVVGMGGSALRALAFGKPLVVQGEQGFFELLTPDSRRLFEWQGWYGLGEGRSHGPGRLESILRELLPAPDRRRELGAFGRALVHDRYSLEAAAIRQIEFYERAVLDPSPVVTSTASLLAAVGPYGMYQTRKRLARARGRSPRDDFNAAPLAVQARP